jgi:hypothetical protein
MLDEYEKHRLNQMIYYCKEYKRKHNGQEMMIVNSNCGLQGYAYSDKSFYPVVYDTVHDEIRSV